LTVEEDSVVASSRNTMRSLRPTDADMLPDIGHVPAGVVEIMKRQQQGWAYLRP
jgi:intracellular sulfur oxidation DsrE/DsrF family protein